MLEKGESVNLYSDELTTREPQLSQLKVKDPQKVTVTMADQGGFVIVK